jgi:AcrR family transcriptional regulator
MKNGRTTIASIRREQIVDAAIAVIGEQGLHGLSLSEIEAKAEMSRGQLTYYFKTKEDILLAVFDRVLQMMCQRMSEGVVKGDGPPPCQAGSWEVMQHVFEHVLLHPPIIPEFNTLQYTFLSQIGYREDFRQRLATLYEEWRAHMAHNLEADQARGRVRRPVPARAMATVFQALLHGILIQAAADPAAFDRQEVLNLCLDMLGTYLGVNQNSPPPVAGKRPRRSATPATAKE